MRLRRIGHEQWLTLKLRDGMARDEVTIALSSADSALLWPLTAGRRLRKTCCHVPLGPLTVEIDIYHGTPEGLVVAEVEFKDEASWRAFVPPNWSG